MTLMKTMLKATTMRARNGEYLNYKEDESESDMLREVIKEKNILLNECYEYIHSSLDNINDLSFLNKLESNGIGAK